MSVRRLFQVAATVLLAVTLGVAGCLVAAGFAMRSAERRLAETSATVRDAEGVELAILVHNRAIHLYALTQGPKYAAAASAAEKRVRRGLDQARQHAKTARELTALGEVESNIASYLATRGEIPDGPDAVARYQQILGAPDLALAAVERLVDLNLAEAQAAEESSVRWEGRATAAGIGTVLLLLATVVAVVVGLRRALLGPLTELRAAIARFGAGDREARARETGVIELQEVGRAFNVMSAALGRQRENQLAFLAGVAHDVRNSLNGLKIAAGTLGKRQSLPDEANLRRMLAMMNRQVERIDRMAEDLVDRTRIEAGHLDLQPERQDLRDIVAEACELYRDTTPDHRLERRLPDACIPAYCDSHRILQVLDNLLSNAIKYSPCGGRVAVDLGVHGEQAVISVSDEGVGMTPDETAHLFEPFRRGGVSAKLAPGVGLGLSVAHRIVEAHGGRITVETTPGRGSTFRVWLPAAPRLESLVS